MEVSETTAGFVNGGIGKARQGLAAWRSQQHEIGSTLSYSKRGEKDGAY